MILSAQSPLNSTSSALCLICVRKDSMANLWRAPGNLRKSSEILGKDGKWENQWESPTGIPTEFQQILTSWHYQRVMRCARYPTAALGRHRPWKTLFRTQIATGNRCHVTGGCRKSIKITMWLEPWSTNIHQFMRINHGFAKVDRQWL